VFEVHISYLIYNIVLSLLVIHSFFDADGDHG
jgi:hypothetical protein